MKNYKTRRWDSTGVNDYAWITCLKCNEDFVDFGRENTSDYTYYTFCPNCGEKLDD